MPKVTETAKGKRNSSVQSPVETKAARLSFGHMPKRTRRTLYVDLLEAFEQVPGHVDALVEMKTPRKSQSVVLGLRRTIKRDERFEDMKVSQVGDEIWISK